MLALLVRNLLSVGGESGSFAGKPGPIGRKPSPASGAIAHSNEREALRV